MTSRSACYESVDSGVSAARVYAQASLLAALLIAGAVDAHQAESSSPVTIDWRGAPQIARTVAAGSDRVSPNRPLRSRIGARVETRDDRQCLVGEHFLFDVDDRFAFDIDEDLTLELLFDGTVPGGYRVAYDHAVNPTAFNRNFDSPRGARWARERVTLKRARFANRNYRSTDLSVGAARNGEAVALCGLSIMRGNMTEASRRPGRLTISLRDEHGRPTAARVGLYRPDGKAPLAGRDALTVARFGERVRQLPLRHGQLNWPAPGRYVFYVNDRYATDLAPGRYTLFVTKGPEYRRFEREVVIATDAQIAVEVRLARWRDLPAAGWYSGDGHIHVPRASPGANAAIMAFAQAEDIHVSNLLQIGDVESSLFEQYAFGDDGQYLNDVFALLSGQESPRTTELGHAIGLNAKRFHWPRKDYYLYHRTGAAIRAEGGMFGYAHVAQGAFNVDRGLAIDVPLGGVDFIEILQANRLNTALFYDFLNMGFRLLPSAGSDYPYIHVAGTERIYVHLDGEFNVPAWFSAWKTNRSFVSNGPLIEFTVNGDGIGNEYELAAKAVVEIVARASVNPDVDRLARFELVVGGEVVASGRLDDRDLVLDHRFRPARSTWLVLRAYGLEKARAHTSAVYLYVDGERRFHDLDKSSALAERYLELAESARPDHRDPTNCVTEGDATHRLWCANAHALGKRIDRSISIYRSLVKE